MSDYTKGEGGKIAIKFDRPLIGDVSGNSQAFTISGNEPRWIGDTPQPKTYTLSSVTRHPEQTEDTLLLTMTPTGRFNNVVGDIMVEYDATKGTLAGDGGWVSSFTRDFTPEDLEPKGNPMSAEHIAAAFSNYKFDLVKITFIDVTPKEYIGATFGNYKITLIHIDDITP